MGAGLLVAAVDDGAFVSVLVSLGLLRVGRVAVPDWEWLSSLDHRFSAREGDHRPGDGDPQPKHPVREGVLAALDDRPHTRRELWEAVDAEADAIDEALATLQEEGTITRVGSEFRVDGSA